MLGIAYEPVFRGTAVITLLLAELKQLSSAVVGLVDSPVVEVGLVHNPEVEVVQQVDNLNKSKIYYLSTRHLQEETQNGGDTYIILKMHICYANIYCLKSTLVSFTNKTDRHDIAEILLKVALNIITTFITTTFNNISIVPFCLYSSDCVVGCLINYFVVCGIVYQLTMCNSFVLITGDYCLTTQKA
jgi:hypothetical protein